MQIETLIQEIKDAAFEVRKNLGPGYLEKVYKNALMVEFALRGLPAERETPLSVFYKGEKIGEYYADIVVDGRVIIEVKATTELSTAHEVQLVNYLNATGIDWGLLINYGGTKYRVMKKSRLYQSKNFGEGSTFS